MNDIQEQCPRGGAESVLWALGGRTRRIGGSLRERATPFADSFPRWLKTWWTEEVERCKGRSSRMMLGRQASLSR